MNVADMTCEEVNEALAKFRGEEQEIVPRIVEILPSLDWPVYGPGIPDYCDDWKWAGKVLEDMCRPTLSQHNNDDQWSASYWKDIGDGGAVVRLGPSCDGPPEAIARAGLQMYLEEET